MLSYAQNPLDTFPRNFPVVGRFSDTANYVDMSRCREQFHNKLAKSRCNAIWETTRVARHNRHNGLLPAPITYYGLVADLLYGEIGVMDFGKTCHSLTPLFFYSRKKEWSESGVRVKQEWSVT